MADCSKITAGLVAANCAKSAIYGNGGSITLLNYTDIDKSESTVTNNVISAIVLKGTAKGFVFGTLPNSIDPAPALAKGKYFSKFQHDLTVRVFVKNELAKAFVNSLTTARLWLLS